MLPLLTQLSLIGRASDFERKCPLSREECVECYTRFVKNRLTRDWHADRCTLNIEPGTQLTDAHRFRDVSQLRNARHVVVSIGAHGALRMMRLPSLVAALRLASAVPAATTLQVPQQACAQLASP